MNKLALELNEVLEGTVIRRLLSEFGKRFYFPKGIVAQSGEAKKHAKRFNATIGMAYMDGKPIFLPSIRNLIPGMDPEEIFPYAPTAGIPQLRELWKEEMFKKNPDLERKSFSLPLIVPGLTNGISTIADIFVEKDDPVVIPDMFWGNYRLIFEGRRQAKVVSFPFFNSTGGLNLAAIESTLKNYSKNGKVILLLNFPNNPTGYSPTKEEAGNLISILDGLAREGLNILAVLDDAYFGLFYEDETYKQSLFAPLSTINEHILAVKVDGATKENLAWGFRIGFITFASRGITQEQYDALCRKVMGAVRSSISNSSRPAQSLLLRAIKSNNYSKEKEAAFEILKKRYLKVKEILSKHGSNSVITPLPFNSGYFMTFKLERGSAEELRKSLLFNRSIGTISVGDSYLRVAYSSVNTEHLEELFDDILKEAGNLN